MMHTIILGILKNQIGMITLLFMASIVSAQNGQKKQYTSDLDSLWSRSVYINKITSDGKWVVLTEAFDHKENVLFLKHTNGTITFRFPDSQWVRFSDNNRWFGCIDSNKELHLIDLQTQIKESYHNIQSYSFSKSGEYIAVLQKNNEEETLLIINLTNKSTTFIQAVNKYIWHPHQNSLVLEKLEDNQTKLVLYDIEETSYELMKAKQNGTFNHLVWSKSGNALLFLEQVDAENTLNYYQINGDVITLDDAAIELKFPNFKLGNLEPFISDNGKKILFYRCLKKESTEEGIETMEDWDTEDPWLYPRMKEYKERELESLLTVWLPETNQLMAIETEEKPTSAMDVNHNYAIVFDKLSYEPLYKEFPNTDIYAKNMENGETNLVVQNQYTGSGFITISPYGKYLSYYKDNHWWVFDFYKKQAYNLTEDLNISFENFEIDTAGDAFPFGNPGWSKNDEFILLYDQYDIWLMSPDGRYKERITKGREEKIKYRVSKNNSDDGYNLLSVNRSFLSQSFNLDISVILEISDDFHKTGYAIWRKRNKITMLIFEENKIDGIQNSEDFNSIIFRRQKYNESPRISKLNLKNNKEQLLYQSNKELLNYDLGIAKLMEYNIGNKILLGTLMFPANFDPKKKYPMIVSIYEKPSSKINIFDPPSYYDFTGFNALKYTTSGYFVLLPDIFYVLQYPGLSALNCVTAAVNEALDSGFIDSDKIGLIGHSFGGYQSAFIATQTDIFAAVVAGASVTNFTSHYHSVGWNWKKPEIWRYESQQWRMGDSYYNIKEAYLRNSPLNYVENVKSPILLWTGKEDYQVNWTQSIELFLAMKRLNQKGKLILFENEAHVLLNKQNQKKLSKEIFDWFKKYCN